MKQIILTPLTIFLVGGCACQHYPDRVTVCELPPAFPATTLTHATAETVRHPGIIKAYTTGRYQDPADRRVMHEGHVVYVEEASPTWDLRPQPPTFVPLGPTVSSPDPALSPVRSADEWTLQFNEQKRVTDTMREQSERFQNALGGISTTLSITTNLAAQVQNLGRQQRTIIDRLQLLEESVRRDSGTPTNAFSSVPNSGAQKR